MISRKEYSVEKLSVEIMTRGGNSEIFLRNTEENFTVLVKLKENALMLFSIHENFVFSGGLWRFLNKFGTKTLTMILNLRIINYLDAFGQVLCQENVYNKRSDNYSPPSPPSNVLWHDA